ncbi:Small-subunit processome Utp12 [Penicillium waksmanii]|uniref:Small-subunit processome Utp12 n=1 Tax=Penicillium waksmanii TaxID=69791 RepID=UPI0025473468|nr:Small-subunit processome Utp12 [Penicillium waksmanii]KAJ5987953.1 Small-subunit processome Utp12 [Penicillium waksmanii]
MGKKTSRPASKVSSAASPAAGLSSIGSKSSILRAAFSPSEYQLALFASVIQGLDAQHLRIHDTNTGRLQCEHALSPKETITSLDWGYYGGQGKSRDQSKKKRKRGSDVNGADGLEQGDIVVAFGTSTSDIRMFSPSEDKIVGTLTGAHDKGIKDFKFTAGKPAQEAWSIGGDNKLVQWDLRTGQSIKTIHLPTSSIFTALSRPVPSNQPVICASQTPFLIDMENSDEPAKFPAMRNQIHTVISSSQESAGTGAFLASDGDRFINVFDAGAQKLVRNLVADQEVSSVSLNASSAALEKQILAAVTEDGTIELFTKPFFQPQNAQSGSSAKANRKQMTQKANATLKITRSDSSDACVPVVSTLFNGNEIIVAYTEGGVIPVFERVKVIDETTDKLAFTGAKAVVKSKSSQAVTSVSSNGAKGSGESRVDEKHMAVEQGNILDDDIEMGESRDDAASVSGSEDSDNEDVVKPTEKKNKSTSNTTAAAESDVEMNNAASDDEEEEEEEGAEPSFGELMRANAGQEVDVEAELDDDVLPGALIPGKPTVAVQQIPTGVSLATVLTQSLKTNDNAMLESCFHTGDTSIIRTTIQRLESSLAATLLQRLAERLSSRPGRYGHLLVWVQWTCVAHGGALAGQPELLKRMATLYKVMDQRSSSLPSLLLLKGKLDMLDAQLGLRQSIRGGDEGMDSEDEDNVIYVEGHDDEEDSETEAKPRTKSIRDQAFDEDESMMNGIDESEDDEDDGSEDDDDDEVDDILDVEAEESAGSSDAEESLEENEDDDEDSEGSMVDFVADTEEEGSDDAVESVPPPTKKPKTGGKKKGGKK